MSPDPAAAPLGGDHQTFESVEELYAVLAPVMRAVTAAVGSHCEVVLHDLRHRDMGHTVFAIENGHVSGRSVGGPSTNLGLIALADEGADHDAFGYPGRTSDGRDLSCSTVYYRNAAGSIIASLCLNVDLTPVQSAQSLLAGLLPGRSAAPTAAREIVGPEIDSVLEDMIARALDASSRPVAVMTKPDRVAVVRQLDQLGAFHIKRSVERVAERLGVSRVTAYAYLDEARRRPQRGSRP